MRRIEVVIADDHDLYRDGLAQLIESDTRFQVVGQAATSEDALHLVERLQPSVLTLDVDMPGETVFVTLRRLSRLAPRTRVVVLTVHADRILEREVVRAGACAFLSKSARRSEVLSALTIDKYKEQLPLAASRQLSTKVHSPVLSQRETEVLRLVATAMSNREIAHFLSIAEGTVKRHTSRIYEKLGAKSRMDAVAKAKLAGLFQE